MATYDEMGNLISTDTAPSVPTPVLPTSAKSTPAAAPVKDKAPVVTANRPLGSALKTTLNPLEEYKKDVEAGETAKSQLLIEQAKNKEAALNPILADRQQILDQAQKKMQAINEEMALKPQLPKEQVEDIATLGSVISVLGVMLGSAGKQSANMAMAGITGMLKGYQQGRTDIYEKAKKEFEENLKRLQGMSAQVTAELALYMEQSKNKEAGAQAHLDTVNAITAGGYTKELLKGGMADKVLSYQLHLQRLNQAAKQHKERIGLDYKIAQLEYTQAEQNFRNAISATPGQETLAVIAARKARDLAKEKLNVFAGAVNVPSQASASDKPVVGQQYTIEGKTRAYTGKNPSDLSDPSNWK